MFALSATALFVNIYNLTNLKLELIVSISKQRKTSPLAGAFNMCKHNMKITTRPEYTDRIFEAGTSTVRFRLLWFLF